MIFQNFSIFLKQHHKKKINHCFFFFLFVFVESVGQNYIPLLNQSNEWQLTSCYNEDCITDIYYTDGDTIVDNQSFKILDGYHYISRKFLIRENVPEKKVFMTIILPNRIEEFLLYDFGMQINDSIHIRNPISPFVNNAGYYKLNAVENVIQNNQNHKLYYLSPTESNEISTNNMVWVEGMGSLSIINAPSGIADINGAGIITCFFKNGNLFYRDNSNWGDNCTATLSAPSEEIEQLQIYLTDNKTVIIDQAQNISEITWFDVSGKFLMNQKLIPQPTHSIDVSSMQSGFYILKCNSNYGVKKSFKLILK